MDPDAPDELFESRKVFESQKVSAPEDESPPGELDLSVDSPTSRYVHRLNRENGKWRKKYQGERTRADGLADEIAALKAEKTDPTSVEQPDPPAPPAAPPPDVEERLRALTHRAAVAEIVGDSDALHAATARALLLTATTVNSDGVLVLAGDEDNQRVVVDARVARQILPGQLLRSAGAPGSGGAAPVTMRTPTTADERMVTSQAAYDRMSPQERREAEQRLSRGPR